MDDQEAVWQKINKADLEIVSVDCRWCDNFELKAHTMQQNTRGQTNRMSS